MLETIIALYRSEIGTDPAKNAFIIALCFFILVGIIATIYGTNLLLKLRTARSWPTAKGTIIESKVYTITRKDSGERPRKLNAAEFMFRYVVDGVELISDKLYWLYPDLPT